MVIHQETLTGENNDMNYRGSAHKTVSGRVCQEWSSQTPHVHSYTELNNPESDLRSNFCRNPSDAESIWCYTSDPDVRWELCEEVQAGDKEGLWGSLGVASKYRGYQNVTRSGIECQAWD